MAAGIVTPAHAQPELNDTEIGNTVEDHTTQELAQTLHNKTELSKNEIRDAVNNEIQEYEPYLTISTKSALSSSPADTD
mgnify:CR=1 FL=1